MAQLNTNASATGYDYIMSRSQTDASGCILIPPEAVRYQLSFNAKGYIQYRAGTRPGDPRMVVSTLIKRVTASPEELAALDDPALKHEVSHRCRRKNCVNPDHLVVEPSGVNKSRTYCEVIVYIGDNQRVICRHDPQCIVTQEVLDRALRL